ncbi:hypothetical protein B0O99DRAFT_220424 [Bisporella sp. PMI_857]|nr:hypothetical protein B0O99DRAFT_220424 [Bisporella sp. PMI_857]
MAAPQNPASRSDSKSSSKKKKAKPSTATAPPETSAPVTPAPVSEAAPESNHGDGSYESPYLKELYKNIRNINKKIANSNRAKAIHEENPDKSLEELVTERKINNDQKAQIQKLPTLLAQLATWEDQVEQLKKIELEYKTNLAADKANFEKTITERHAKELDEAVAKVKADAAAKSEKDQRSALLIVSQFLRLAAVRRGEEADADLDENKALEGALTLVYEGNQKAVEVMLKIIQGSEDTTISVNNEPLTTTYAKIKAITLETSAALNPELATAEEDGDSSSEEEVAVETAEYPVQSDPTIANAGLTELDAPPASDLANGHAATETSAIPQNSGLGEGGNAAAESKLDVNNDLSASQEWVEVPRDATETDTGITSTIGAPANTQSWADDQPDTAAQAPTPAPNPNDGFHEVTPRSRGGNRGSGGGRGQNRGRGGNGHRGDGRGRGRGGQRGGQGGGRGGRRPDES